MWRCRSLICYSTACNPDNRAERAYREQRGSEPSLEWETKKPQKTGSESRKRKGNVCARVGVSQVAILSALLQCFLFSVQKEEGRLRLCGSRSCSWGVKPAQIQTGLRGESEKTIENKLILRALQRNIKGSKLANAIERKSSRKRRGGKNPTTSHAINKHA